MSENFKETLRKKNAELTVKIEVNEMVEIIQARGSPALRLTHPKEMVIRKSDFTSDRTLAVHADKAAADLPRALVDKLRNPQQRAKITLKARG